MTNVPLACLPGWVAQDLGGSWVAVAHQWLGLGAELSQNEKRFSFNIPRLLHDSSCLTVERVEAEWKLEFESVLGSFSPSGVCERVT